MRTSLLLRAPLRAAVAGGLVAGSLAVSTGPMGAASDTAPPSTETPSTELSDTREFVDDTGNTVVIPTDPQSVVACGYAVLPLVQAGAQLSGVCEWTRELDNMDDETLAAYEAILKIGPDLSAASLNYEAVAVADPDLIILGVPAVAVADVDLDELGQLAPVLVLAPTVPGEWRELGERYADAAGVGDEYAAEREAYDAVVDEITEEYGDVLENNTFGGVCAPCGIFDGTFVREYASSYSSNLFDDLGAEFPTTTAGPDADHAEDISLENVVESLGDVDVIVYGVQTDGSPEPGMEDLFESDLWNALPAVQAGRVIEIRHHSASTFRTAILALESIREGLAELPAD